jgi:hypothetical protein
MAGTFPDVPGHRFMYDQDGSIFLNSPVSATSPLTVADPLVINDEDMADTIGNPSGNGGYRDFYVIFPEARSLSGMFVSWQNSATLQYSYSLDTTDGTDGSWTAFASLTGFSSSLNPSMRTGIQPLSHANVTGVRIRLTSVGSSNTTYLQVWHIYGTIPITANPERLEFWQPTADSILDKAGLDFGDMPLGSVKTKQLRVKNLSSTKTATSVVVSANNLSGGTANDAMVSGLQFSLDDGATWGTTVTIPTIAPGGISGVVSVRRTLLLSEAVTPRVARVMAIPSAYAA